MFKINNIIIFFVGAFLSASLNAADLLDVYKRALENDNKIKITDADYFIAKEQYDQSLSTVFPEINLTAQTEENKIDKYTGGGSIRDNRSDSYSLNISQPILRLGLFDKLEKASDNIEKYNENRNFVKEDLIIESTKIYFSLIDLMNGISALKIKKSMAELKLSNAGLLYEKGALTNIKLNELKNDYRFSEIDLQQLENEFSSVKQDVFLLTGKEIVDVHNLSTEISFPVTEYDLSVILSKALSDDEMIKMALYDINIAKNDLSSNKAEHYPTVDLLATYDYLDTSSGSYRGASTREGSTVTLVLNFPIFQGGYINSKVRESRYNLEKTKYNLDLTRKNLQKDVINSYNDFVYNQNLVKASKNGLQEAKQNYETIKDGFVLGVNTDIQVIEANYNLHTAKKDYIKAVMDYLVSDLKIKKYSSSLNSKDIELINQWLIW
ncbi:MAG: TolC family protein [Pseudomonadota bacterium]|nr:TolC family protein [Pseudomonadota bacterium]